LHYKIILFQNFFFNPKTAIVTLLHQCDETPPLQKKINAYLYIIASLAPPTNWHMSCSSKYEIDANTGLLQQQNDRDAFDDYNMCCSAKLWKTPSVEITFRLKSRSGGELRYD